MKFKKLIALLMCCTVASAPVIFSGCGEDEKEPQQDVAIEYDNYETSTVAIENQTPSNFSKSLYYINDLALDMGDPMIVYEDGFYYAYGTRGTRSFHCFRSPNLQDWVQLSDCFTPKQESWSQYNLWAPDIKKIGDKWYLYYTARYDYPDGSEHCQLGVAVADHAYGPFEQFTGINADGVNVTLKDTAFMGLEKNTILDCTVFEDDDGELYMYFSYDTRKASEEAREKYGVVDSCSAEIYGVKMKDPVTWDLTTLTRLLSAGYKKVTDSRRTIEWETWSESFSGGVQCLEGPFMIKNNGKYLLTYCANSYVDTIYCVGYAVCDTPLGEYVKPDSYYLENMLLGVPGAKGEYINTRYLGFMTGTGHASIFKAGDEYMFAYHAHTNRDVWGKPGTEHNQWRSLAVDYLYFDSNGMPYTNGPTYSLQRLPESITGYKNIAGEAKVKADGENAQYLIDNRTLRGAGKIHGEAETEATFKSGTRSIELTFETERTIKALNIYNSARFDMRTEYIKQIDFGNGQGIANITFNTSYINYDSKSLFIYPHTAYNIVLLGEIKTKRIVITYESLTDFAVGEIEIIGK